MFKPLKEGSEVVFTKAMLMCAALDTAESADSVTMMTNHLLAQLDEWHEAVGSDAISDAWIEDLRLHLLTRHMEICQKAAKAMHSVHRMK